MRVLLTGASGFIGKAICARFTARGDDVVTLGRTPLNRSGVKDWLVRDVSEIRGDAAPGGPAFDYVCHLAAAGVNPKDRDIERLIDVNIRLGARLLEQIDARAFAYAGSCAEYAEKSDGFYRESDPLQQTDPYGASKAAGSLMHLAVARKLGKPLAVLRLFHVYGPGEKPHRLTTSLFSGLRTGRRVALSPGRQVRDFIYIDDVGAAFDAALAGLAGGRLEPESYNVCTGEGVAVSTVCREIAALAGADESLLGFGDIEMRLNELPRVVGDATAFRKAAGWRPAFSLRDGLRKLYDELARTELKDEKNE